MIDIKVFDDNGLTAHYEVMEDSRPTIFSEAIDRIKELQGKSTGTYCFSLEDNTSNW